MRSGIRASVPILSLDVRGPRDRELYWSRDPRNRVPPRRGEGATRAGAPGAESDPVVIGESGRRYRGAPISLDLKDADLVDVCLSFSKIAGANVVVDPGVRGSVTVRLQDVPWDQALDLILGMNGYAMAREPRIIRIGRPEALAR